MQNDDYVPSREEDREDAFCMEIPINDPVAMNEFQEFMNQLYDSYNDKIGRIALELNVSEKCASDIFYLRTRSRWTEELEDRLIQLHKDGIEVNIFEFPYSF